MLTFELFCVVIVADILKDCGADVEVCVVVSLVVVGSVVAIFMVMVVLEVFCVVVVDLVVWFVGCVSETFDIDRSAETNANPPKINKQIN